jgi:crotonobetainyl-CoA:carnitine CoA-transferase CaiB-like acyl-CoA transferase
MPTGLFGDLLVIDCASFIAGPAAATVLSDFGARVIKIEPPGIGDAYRNLFRLRGTPDDVDYFWALDSRNKESLALDLRKQEARAVLQTLVRRADVFITNLPFPSRERLGLRAQDLRPLNPRLIYASP